MIIGQSFIQFESYIYNKVSNVNTYFFFVISLSLVKFSNEIPLNKFQYLYKEMGIIMKPPCIFNLHDIQIVAPNNALTLFCNLQLHFPKA
jgi:hypothetical protein